MQRLSLILLCIAFTVCHASTKSSPTLGSSRRIPLVHSSSLSKPGQMPLLKPRHNIGNVNEKYDEEYARKQVNCLEFVQILFESVLYGPMFHSDCKDIGPNPGKSGRFYECNRYNYILDGIHDKNDLSMCLYENQFPEPYKIFGPGSIRIEIGPSKKVLEFAKENKQQIKGRGDAMLFQIEFTFADSSSSTDSSQGTSSRNWRSSSN